MRNRSILVALLLIFALLLAACGGAEGNQNGALQGTEIPADAGEGTSEIPSTGGEATQPIVEGTAPVPTLESMTQEAIETPADSVEATEEVETTPTPAATEDPAAGQDEPSGESGLIGIPETGSGELAGLSAMLGFQVVDTSGNEIGTVRDYVINTCEAHILYMVVDPAEGAVDGVDQQILIPYQVTLEMPNNGQVNAGESQFVIELDTASLNGAPAVDFNSLDMQDPTWDAEAQAFWGEHFELALTAACPVPVSGSVDDPSGSQDTADETTPTAEVDDQATATLEPEAEPTDSVDRQNVYDVALASELLTARLQDGNGQLLGAVREVAIVPETGRTQFILVAPEAEGEDAGAGRLVALPPGAVNLEYEDVGMPVLVLLEDTQVFNDAPGFDPSTGANDAAWFDYWGEFVPMTQEELP